MHIGTKNGNEDTWQIFSFRITIFLLTLTFLPLCYRGEVIYAAFVNSAETCNETLRIKQ